MSTVALLCPYCGDWLRVAVQPSGVEWIVRGKQLGVRFSDQLVAHICNSERKTQREEVLLKTALDLIEKRLREGTMPADEAARMLGMRPKDE